MTRREEEGLEAIVREEEVMKESEIPKWPWQMGSRVKVIGDVERESPSSKSGKFNDPRDSDGRGSEGVEKIGQLGLGTEGELQSSDKSGKGRFKGRDLIVVPSKNSVINLESSTFFSHSSPYSNSLATFQKFNGLEGERLEKLLLLFLLEEQEEEGMMEEEEEEGAKESLRLLKSNL